MDLVSPGASGFSVGSTWGDASRFSVGSAFGDALGDSLGSGDSRRAPLASLPDWLCETPTNFKGNPAVCADTPTAATKIAATAPTMRMIGFFMPYRRTSGPKSAVFF